MKKSIPSILMLFVCFYLNAQYSIDWIRSAEDNRKMGSMITRDNSDNVIVTGYIQSSSIYTRSYDKSGSLKWERIDTSGIHSIYEKSKWINADASNNVYVVGYQYAFSSGSDYPNAIVVLKYNTDGVLLWKQVIPGVFSREMRGEIDAAGNLYAGAAGNYPGATSTGFVLVKVSPAGTLLFKNVQSFGSAAGFSSMRLNGSRVIITGTSDISGFNLSTAEWDTSGAILWSNTLPVFTGKDVELDNSGNAYVLTTYPNQVSATSGTDIILYKFGPAGNQLWKQAYDFGGQETAIRLTIVSDKISIIGYGSKNGSYFDWITFQINSSGTKLWDVRYDMTSFNDEKPYWVTAKSNGDVFVSGQGGPLTTQSNGSSYLSFVTLKYSNGIQQWVDTGQYKGYIGIASVLATDGSVFVLGQTSLTTLHYLDFSGTVSCAIPANANAGNITTNSSVISWSPVSGASLYHLRYKATTSSVYNVISTTANSYNLTGLASGTVYNYSVETVCSSGASGYTAEQTFTTLPLVYCSTSGQSTAKEYVSLVWIGAIKNTTGSNNGYANFTSLSTNLTKAATITGYLQGTLGGKFKEYYRVWIDYNQDGDFEDPGELAASISSSAGGLHAINFTVPATATPGTTRMRVTMKYGSVPLSCGVYSRGETEDYTVTINAASASIAALQSAVNLPNQNEAIEIYPNPAAGVLYIRGISTVAGNHVIEVYDIAGRVVLINTVTANNVNISALKTGIYLVKVYQNSSVIYAGRFMKQ
ncbi:hypothetical protein BH10BAC3_BH10BAC3_24590 [soil metagenome]